ncbi:hypothetical protein DPMN_005210 [Dreissena polymorpha]|uniref:Uncharacterized protein n=1 Tax=Dreissena polymorpha TaxID=45954 RepID=A0A9D4MPX2_DREPO|nr:hypothetical protein DPMN_005210 [Dreissena polymorpha]
MFDPRGAPGLIMGPCIVESDRIVIRYVQYQFEVSRCKNEEVIVKGNFGWVWPMWAGCPRVGNGAMHKVQYQLEVNQWGAPGLVMGPCIVEIDHIVYQFEVNRCNFGWVWSMWAGFPWIDRIVIREVQYQLEVNRCRNEEVNFQGFSSNSVGGDSGQDGQTAEITTISPRFSKSWG